MEIALTTEGMVASQMPTRHRSGQPAPTIGIDAWFDDGLPRIYGYFLPRLGGHQALAEDLTHETLLAAIRSSNGPRDPERVLPWLYGIARHKLIDHYREKDRQFRALGSQVSDERIIDEAASLPDLDLESLPVREAVIETLDALNPRHRAAIILRYLDDCELSVICETFFLTPSAAESMLARARAAFRAAWIARHGERS